MIPYVEEVACEGFDGAEVWVTVCFVVDADALPPVFVVIQFQRCAIGCLGGPGRCLLAELPSTALFVLTKEGNAADAELGRLFGLLADPFNGVLTYPQ